MRVMVEQLPPAGGHETLRATAVVLPCYNEQDHVSEVVQRCLDAGADKVVCVNDCSTDRTASLINRLAERKEVIALHHRVNQGKQAAVKHGLQAALEDKSIRTVALLDADMQDDPALLPGLCPYAPDYRMVMGRRTKGKMPAVRRAANALSNLPYSLARVRVHDIQCGYRVYDREPAAYLARRLSPKGRYTLEHTCLLHIARMAMSMGIPCRVAEAPIPFTYAGAESNVGLADTLQLTWASIYHAAILARLQLKGVR